MAQGRHLNLTAVTVAILDCGVLTIACLLSYWLVTYLLARLHSVSAADDMLGGLWAVIATVFVCRFSYTRAWRPRCPACPPPPYHSSSAWPT
jgi:hypothetical protein